MDDWAADYVGLVCVGYFPGVENNIVAAMSANVAARKTPHDFYGVDSVMCFLAALAASAVVLVGAAAGLASSTREGLEKPGKKRRGLSGFFALFETDGWQDTL